MTATRVLFVSFVLACAQTSLADIKTDLLALTGGREVRAAWLRIPWCDSSYTPVQTFAADGAGKHTKVAVYSTSETGGIRHLDSDSAGDHNWDFTFITRKDGSHVIWSNGTTKTAWVQAFDGKTPKVPLNLGADWEIVTTQYNPASGEENIYVRSDDLASVYRIPFKSDYTVDLTKKTLVVSSSWAGGNVDDAFSVSGDGIMAGGAFPWPDTKILNTNTKTVHSRHKGSFGCNSNIAPDNSYRFYHFFDDHTGLHMWDSALSTTTWDMPVTGNLPGNTAKLSLDCKLPRWTNNAQFMSLTYPGPLTGLGEAGNFTLSSAQVKALNPATVGHFCLGKFGADFKSVNFVLIAGGDVRIIEGTAGGTVWIAPAASVVERGILPPLRGSVNPAVSVRGAVVEARFPSGVTGTVAVVNTSGRVVAQASGAGYVVCALGGAPAGTYIVWLAAGPEIHATRLLVRR